MNYCPQVLLLGNGLIRSYGGGNWFELLKSIHSNYKVSLGTIQDLPFPLMAVLATGDKVDDVVKNKNELFQGLKDLESIRQPMEELLSIPFDHILTTNYSYEIERVADSRVDREGKYCKKLMRHTSSVAKAESDYLLHTYNEAKYGSWTHRIWHIHGEVRKPKSVVLGHYYYGKMLGKYQEFLRERGNSQAYRIADGKEILQDSWLDAFIMGDVYILGFGFDFSEFDLWWLLNRKKRETAPHGKTIFYTPIQNNEVKVQLLQAYGAKPECLGHYTEPSDFKEFYLAAIKDIKTRVTGK